MNSAPAVARFVRRTTLEENEYRVNFKQIDSDVLDALASDEACSVTPLMCKIYVRLIRAPLCCYEREGVLHLIGEDEAGKSLTAWQRLCKLTGVANSTLSKALAWMNKTGIIGYDARKNGVGIRIFINRAAASIRCRDSQKNLRLVPAPSADSPAPQNGAPFKEGILKRDLEIEINPCARAQEETTVCKGAAAPEQIAADKERAAAPRPCPIELAVPQSREVPPTRPPADAALNAFLIRQLVNQLKPEITAAIGRETSNLKDWFLNRALPKAARVAQRESYDLLRAYGVIAKKPGHSASVGQNNTRPEAGQGREAETNSISAFIAEASQILQQLSTRAESPGLSAPCQIASRELDGLRDQLIAGELLMPEKVESRLAAIEDALSKAVWAAWEASDPAECDLVLKAARAELREYETRLEREAFADTVQRRIAAKLRERFQLPPLSLFYL